MAHCDLVHLTFSRRPGRRLETRTAAVSVSVWNSCVLFAPSPPPSDFQWALACVRSVAARTRVALHSSRGVCRPVNIYPADGSGGDGSLPGLRVPASPPSIGRGFRLDTRPVKLSDNVWDLFESPRGFVGKHRPTIYRLTTRRTFWL